MSIDIGMEIGGAYSPADMQDCQKSLAEFAADAENSVQIVFGRGLYVDKNTSQAASVEFVRQRRTNYARSRLQKLAESPEGDFRHAERSGLSRSSGRLQITEWSWCRPSCPAYPMRPACT